MGTEPKRVRHLSDAELLSRIVGDLIDCMIDPWEQEKRSARFSRWARELKRRDLSGYSHHPDCVCEACCDKFDLGALFDEGPPFD